jgi:hypothetical protein
VRRPRLAAALALTLSTGGAGAVAVATVGPFGAASPELAEAAPAVEAAPPSSPAVPPVRARPAPPPPATPSADARVRPPTPVRTEPSPDERRLAERRRLEEAIVWRRSQAVGRPDRGRLVDGVQLPREGVHFFTWDPVRWTAPNEPSRLHATDRLIRTILTVAREHRAAHPGAPRIAVGDLSRPEGGSFDARFGVLEEFGRGGGSLGHVSHQNGLDADIYYPRRDRAERAPDRLEDIDLALAQDLVDRFVAAGAQFVFVGPRTGLKGPPGVVQPLARHDDHLHVRLRPHG